MSADAPGLGRRGWDFRETLFKGVLLVSLVVGFATLVTLLVDVFVTGWSHVTWEFLTSPPSTDPTTTNLAIRNTLRGKRVGLPSGQQVAKAMRVPVLSNATLGLSNDPGWGGEAPLWYYILKEAELAPYYGERLGPVGGRIMAETLVGLLQRDPNSYLYLDPSWKPQLPSDIAPGKFEFSDLLKFAGAAPRST